MRREHVASFALARERSSFARRLLGGTLVARHAAPGPLARHHRKQAQLDKVVARIGFLLNGAPHAVERTPPTMTVLDYLRTVAGLTGTKEGCAEGDCGACTILVARPENGTLAYRAVNSCLMMLPQLDGVVVRTVGGRDPAATARCTRCSRPWSRRMPRNAASARPAS